MFELSTMTAAQLSDLKTKIDAELAHRISTGAPSNGSQPMRVTIEFPAYNERRYSRPWIAVVTSWPVGGRPELEFGSYLGNSRGGVAEVMARPGQIVRAGQKDTRGSNTDNDWYHIADDGTLKKITQAEARLLFV